MPMRKTPKGWWLVAGALAALVLTDAAHAQKKTLVVALNQDPDILDPTLARTYVGRIIFSQMCEKLYEIDEGLRIQPQLAAAMPAISDGGRTVTIKLRPGVKFNDGTPMDAESVRFSLERHRTLKGSNRASELAPVEAVEVVDPLTVRLRLKAPFSPLLAQLTDRAGTPLSHDPRVREAFELSIDREALNQVAWDGLYTPGCTPIPPISVYFDKSRKCPGRDVARAKKLLADAGHAGGYGFEMTIVNNPRERRVGEVIQQMAREAGFNISLRAQEFASALTDNEDGKHQAFLIGWSGRVDPDGNIHQVQTCKGSLNTTLACDEKIDALLNRAREVSDVDQRRGLYREAIDLFDARRNIIYIYHLNYIVAFPKNLKGYKAVPDGLIRIKGTSWN